MTNRLTCGQALVRLLEDHGVDTVFGIPGVHTLELYRGLDGSPLRHVQPRHEQGAGFMADGYARASGRPGVCFLITGPGVTNAATPIGQAYSDSVPMLVISSVNDRASLGKGWGCLHEITDQQATTAPLTAFTATALSAEDLPELLARAFDIFGGARPRPVHIEVPIDVFPEEVEDTWRRTVSPARAEAPGRAVDAAVALLAKAERPVIIVGGGGLDAGGPISALAERLAAPVVTTIAAKGVVPDSHPLSLGGTLYIAATRDYLARADVVLAIGTELSETDTWHSVIPFAGKLIRVDIDPAKMNDQYRADLPILGDAAGTARAMAAALERLAPRRDAKTVQAEVAALREAARADLSPPRQAMARVLDTLAEALPSGGMVFSDMTQIAYLGNSYFPAERPRTWFHPVGYGTLGHALPAAIGARLAKPEAAVVALMGDGGFMFTVQELATAVELELPVVLLLWNNEAYGQIQEGMTESGIAEIGVRPRNPDFIALAKAFGCRTAKPESQGELAEALEGAFGQNRPTLIELDKTMGAVL